jgi:hypothetical protein
VVGEAVGEGVVMGGGRPHAEGSGAAGRDDKVGRGGGAAGRCVCGVVCVVLCV